MSVRLSSGMLAAEACKSLVYKGAWELLDREERATPPPCREESNG